MKYCPQCQTSYTDDTLKYCKRDGAPLETATDMPTVNFGEEATVVSSRQVEPIRVPIENQPPTYSPTPQDYQQQTYGQQNWQQQSAPLPLPQQQPQIIAAPPEAKKSRTGLAVALTALGMLLLFGLVGAGALFYMRDKNRETALANNGNGAPANRPSNQNAATNQNANLSTPTPSATPNATLTPSATPTPKPALDPKEAKAATENVGSVIDAWAEATENRDIDAHIGQYADTVDYYKGGRVSAARVRADRARAFEMYDSMRVNISNVKITPDAAGEKATAVLDKEWEFSGGDKFSNGKVRQQLTFAKIGGKWLITGEKDLKLYYKTD